MATEGSQKASILQKLLDKCSSNDFFIVLFFEPCDKARKMYRYNTEMLNASHVVWNVAFCIAGKNRSLGCILLASFKKSP